MTLEIKESDSLTTPHSVFLAVFMYGELSDGRINSFSELEHFVLEYPAITKLLNILHYEFGHPTYLLEALVHTSFANEFAYLEVTHNEQIEFLGDSVLNLLFTGHLIQTFEDFSEGDLSKFRGSLINEDSFYELAKLLKLGECVLLGKGEIVTKGMARKSLLADVFEALFGAIYKDGGHAAAHASFIHLLAYYKEQIGQDFIHIQRFAAFDAKTKLQEKTMELFKELPEYSSCEHQTKGFHVTVSVNNIVLAETFNRSKKLGEKELAKIVLSRIQSGEQIC